MAKKKVATMRKKRAATRTKATTTTNAQPTSSVEAARDLIAQAQKENRDHFGGINYLRWKEGTNTLRLIFDPNDTERLPFLRAFLHAGQGPEGKFATPLDLRWAINTERIREALGDRVTEEDIELLAQYGDPAHQLAALFSGQKLAPHLKDLWNKPFARSTYYWNARLNDEWGIMGLSEAQWRGVENCLVDWPDIFHPELGNVLKVQVTGSGKQRTIEPAVPTPAPDPVNPLPRLFDLTATVRSKYMGFNDKVAFVLRSYAPFCEEQDVGEDFFYSE
jgi:hypothetical protein